MDSRPWQGRAHVIRRRVRKLRRLLQGDSAHPQPPVPKGESPVVIATILRRSGAVGVNTHIAQTAELLAEHGRPVTVMSLDSWLPLLGPLLLAPPFVIRRLRLDRLLMVDRYLTRLSLELSLRRAMRTALPRVVYAQDPLSAEAAVRARGTAAVPVVMAIHYNESQAEELVNFGMIRRGSLTDRAIRRFEADLLPRLDGLVFVSDFMREHVYAMTPRARRVPTATIPNFLHDLGPVAAPHPSRDCISVGLLDRRKNHRYLLDVIAAARRQGRSYTLTIVGDGPERGDLERRAQELGIADLVAFLGERYDVDTLLPDHRVYVHSAFMENCPFALLEAFRAALPVVAAPVGGIPEVMDGEACGLWWDLDDPESGARVLAEVLEDRPRYSRMAEAARARFESTYDAVVVGGRLSTFLDRVAAEGARVPADAGAHRRGR